MAHLRADEIILFGGDSIHNISHEIYSFNTTTHTLTRQAPQNKINVIPSYFPCVKSQSNNIITIDSASFTLNVYNTVSQKVNKLNSLVMLSQKDRGSKRNSD